MAKQPPRKAPSGRPAAAPTDETTPTGDAAPRSPAASGKARAKPQAPPPQELEKTGDYQMTQEEEDAANLLLGSDSRKEPPSDVDEEPEGEEFTTDPPETDEEEGADASQTQPFQEAPAGEATEFASPPADDATELENAAAAPASKPGTTVKLSALGDFRLLKKLGEGGMGAVYKAQQVSLERDVAVKVLAKHLVSSSAFVQRFQREARVMAKLDHPNILRCYSVGEAHGFHYLAMEFVDGGSMQDWLKKLGKLSVGDAVHVVLASAQALEHAHELKMIHRDIKPDNVLLTSKGVVKVADLGLAKTLQEDTSLTQTGTGAGTPMYMAPEQFKDAKHVDHRTDIYALGCMLYAFLTGKPPFEGETYVELFEAKMKGKFPPARRANAAIPERLDLMIDKMLAVKPELRYQTCTDLMKDLEGLGLANATLSFLGSPAASRPRAIPARGRTPGETPAVTRVTAVGAQPPKPATRPSAPAAAPGSESEEAPSGFWFIALKNNQGRVITRKLTEAQVLELIKSDDFDPRMQASRTLKGDYRGVATYPEFERLLRHRMARSRADRKAAKFKNMYEKIEREEETWERRRWFRDIFRSMKSGVGLVIWLAALAGVGVLIYLLVRYGWDSFAEWFRTKIWH